MHAHHDAAYAGNPAQPPRAQHPWLALAGWLLLTFAGAAAGAAASRDAAGFYASLVRPEWAPPAMLFGPVWSVLYTLMGIAAWLAWRAGASRGTLALYVVQLVLNALWSALFFGAHRGALAFVDILALIVLVVATIRGFWRVRPAAGALLLPYLAWISFAAVLNYAVWQLNPQLLGG
jgi:tryptophan-rich sensory protein